MGEKNLSSPSCRTQGSTFMVHEQQAVTQPEWTRGVLTSGPAPGSKEGKKTPGLVLNCLRGKFFPDHNTANQLSLIMRARPASDPQAAHATQILFSFNLEAPQEHPRVVKSPRPIDLGGQNPSHAWQGTSGALQSNISASHFLQLLPWLHGE